jgi:DNA-binding NtrC family response regulator
MARLIAYEWPGNVRQLENEIRRVIVLSDGVVERSHLSSDIQHPGEGAKRHIGLHVRERVDALETDLVKSALSQTSGNQTRAAEVLGLSRFGLQKMMKRLGI